MRFSFPVGCLVALCLIPPLSAADDRLRSLNVAVLDAQGKPVTGLQTSDFALLIDGRPVPLAYSRFTGDKPSTPTTPGPPGQLSNRIAHRPTVILLDLLNGRPLTGKEIIDQTVDAVTHLDSQADLYLYILTARGKLLSVHPLPTPDTEPPASGRQWTRDIGPLLTSAFKNVFGLRNLEDSDVTARLSLTSAAILELSGSLRWISGRKSLVWVTHGVPLCGTSSQQDELVDLTTRLREMCGQLAQAQVVVYPVMQSWRGAAAAVGTLDEESLEEVAALTGGRKYRSGYFDQALQQAIVDSRASYQLSYYSAEPPDRKYHKVRVTCTRPDVRLQTKAGFYSLAVQTDPREMIRSTLEEVLHGPFDTPLIGIRAAVSPTPASKQSVRFDVRVDPADLLLRPVPPGRTGRLSLWFAACDSKGWTQPASPGPVDLRLSQEQYDAALRDGLEFHQVLRISTDARKVRAIVVDEQLGVMGSVTLPIER